MKFLFAFGFAALVAGGYFFATSYRANDPEAAHAEWKRTTVEAETKVRPESFEQMKWNPNDPQPVEMRAPASAKAKKSKK